MSDSVSADPRIGSEIAGYRVERLLGRGGMSVVYLAEQVALKRQVALKLIAPELAKDGRFRERFLRESELAASLDHPNVIPIFDAGEAEGVLFLAMRYVEGSDLSRRLAGSGWLDPAEAVSIVERVADALDAAHTQGLVHRDVKPGNVLISTAGHVYLADFGLTRRTEETASLTETGQVVGTLDYVAPEQIENKGVSAATDVYSLACVLFESLAGEVPFQADSTMGMLFAHLQNEPPSASESNPELPPDIDEVLARGMAKKSEGRYPTCGELAEEARSALGLSGEITQPVVELRRSMRRRVLVFVALVLVVAVAAAVAAILLTGENDPQLGEEWSRVPSSQAVFGGVTGVQRMAAVERSGSGFVAVGTDDSGGDADAAVWLSSDGVAWSRVSHVERVFGGEHIQVMTNVAATDSGPVVVGWTNAVVSETGSRRAGPAAWVSADGQVWTSAQVDAPLGDGVMLAVARGGPGLVAVGGNNSFTEPWVWTSTDGAVWTHVRDPDPNSDRGTMFDIAARDGRLVAVGVSFEVGRSTAAAWVSEDGRSWARATDQDAFGVDAPSAWMTGVIATEGGFVAVGVSTATVGTFGIADPAGISPSQSEVDAVVWLSIDGLTWTLAEGEAGVLGGEGAQGMTAVVSNDKGLVAVGFRGTGGELSAAAWLSEDGTRWRLAADPAGAFQRPDRQWMTDATLGGPGLVSIGADGSVFDLDAAVWTSP